MKSIFEKWKSIFKRSKKHRCLRDQVHDEVDTELDYDPVSREEVKEIPPNFLLFSAEILIFLKFTKHVH